MIYPATYRATSASDTIRLTWSYSRADNIVVCHSVPGLRPDPFVGAPEFQTRPLRSVPSRRSLAARRMRVRVQNRLPACFHSFSDHRQTGPFLQIQNRPPWPGREAASTQNSRWHIADAIQSKHFVAACQHRRTTPRTSAFSFRPRVERHRLSVGRHR